MVFWRLRLHLIYSNIMIMIIIFFFFFRSCSVIIACAYPQTPRVPFY